jgi:hypothetical protein
MEYAVRRRVRLLSLFRSASSLSPKISSLSRQQLFCLRRRLWLSIGSPDDLTHFGGMASPQEHPFSRRRACGGPTSAPKRPLIVGIALASAASFGRSPDVGAMGFRGCLLNFRVGLAADKNRSTCEI